MREIVRFVRTKDYRGKTERCGFRFKGCISDCFFFLEFFDDHYIYQLYINIVEERFGKLITQKKSSLCFSLC